MISLDKVLTSPPISVLKRTTRKRVAGLVSIEQMQRNKFCCEKMIVSPAVTFPYSAQVTSWSRALFCIIMLLSVVLSPDIETTHHASSTISLLVTDASHRAEACTNLNVPSPISLLVTDASHGAEASTNLSVASPISL